ncbi:hypothetical protein Hanom_Chr06g00561211 [Helianthus anomalus]
MCCWLNYDLYKRNAFSDSNSGPLSHICFFFLVGKRDIFCELNLSAKLPLPGLFDGGSESASEYMPDVIICILSSTGTGTGSGYGDDTGTRNGKAQNSNIRVRQ